MIEHGVGVAVAFSGSEIVPISVLHTHKIDCISVVVPTRNEAENIEPLLSRLEQALQGVRVEVIFVDDSEDDTATRIADLMALCTTDRFVVRLEARGPAERAGGLSGAVLRGIALATHRWVCVMDGDLQHPPAVIATMIAKANTGHVDLIAASRYTDDGSNAGLSNGARRLVSSASGLIAKTMFGSRLARLSDPMTGFFLLNRERIDLGRLRPRGFKILLEIVVSHAELRLDEVPFVFGSREFGESKASAAQGVSFIRQLADLKMTGASRLTWLYNIHGIIGVESDKALPELQKFLVRSLPPMSTITVKVGRIKNIELGETVDVTSDVPVVSYRERSGFAMRLELGAINTTVTVSPFVAKSPHVMYTNVVEAILRWKLVEAGYALVHAACFADGDDAYLVTALTDTGKTTTMLKVLDHSDLSFISDDLIVMSPDGTVRTFPKPLTISAHTVHALRNTDLSRIERIALVPQSRIHSREGRLLAFLLTKYRLPVASINAMIQRLIPPPKYHVERLVRGVTSRERATARGMFIIQRGGTGDQHTDTPDALETLLANCDDAFGFPPYSSLERLLLAVAGEDLKQRERDIVRTALGALPVLTMRSDTLDWAERIPHAVRTWTTPSTYTSDLSAVASTNGTAVPEKVHR